MAKVRYGSNIVLGTSYMNQVETEEILIVYSCVKCLPKSWQSPAISTQSMSSSVILYAFSWSCAFKCRMNRPARWHVLHNMIEPDVKITNNWLQLKVVSQAQRQIYLQVSSSWLTRCNARIDCVKLPDRPSNMFRAASRFWVSETEECRWFSRVFHSIQ